MKNLLIVVFLILALPSCVGMWRPYAPTATPAELKAAHSSWTESEIKTVLDSKIRIGMTEEHLLVAWGLPIRWHRTTYSFGVIKYLFYPGRTVHTQDGIITIISEH